MTEGYDLLGVLNWSDHFPILDWLDLQGVRKRYGSLVDKVNVVVRKIILEHGVKRVVEGEDKTRFTKSSTDFVDVMLDLKKEKRLRHSDMVVVLWVSFFIFNLMFFFLLFSFIDNYLVYFLIIYCTC